MNLSDRAVSLIRTLVPKLWGLVVGAMLAWLGTHAPWAISALDFLGIDLDGVAAVVIVVALSESAWYAVWRWAEPRIPAWLARIVLGSANMPMYGVEFGEVQWLEVDEPVDHPGRHVASSEAEADAQAAGNDHTQFPYV